MLEPFPNTSEHRIYWALQWGIVRDEKWHYSEREGRDIGVPATVDRLIIDHPDIFTPEDRIPLIEGYLLGVGMYDQDGPHQWRGELRRFIAQKDGISVRDVWGIGEGDVRDYCKINNIEGKLARKLLNNY